jgi:hypothetical protein
MIAIFDVSGSTQELAKTFPNTMRTLLMAEPKAIDGTTMTVVVADGSSQATPCTPRRVQMVSEGDSPTKRSDSLNRSINKATQLVAAQINCGLDVNTKGSDLIGSLYAADGQIKSGLESTRILLFSDGVQYSEDFKFSGKFLTSRVAQKAKLKELAEDGLLPMAMRSGCFTVSDPAYGTKGLSPAAQAGVKKFWMAYAQRVGAKYVPAVSTACES